MEQYKTILYEKRGPVRLITLNRPEVLNAIGAGMEGELHNALDVAEADEEARVIIITGTGRAFSTGYDMSAVELADIDFDTMLPRGMTMGQYVRRAFDSDRKSVYNMTHIPGLSKPVIAAVNGWCMGAGSWYALSCDILLASADAVFSQPEVRQISNTNFLWALMAGYKNALRYALTGDHIDAQEALRIGLIHQILPDKESLMAEAFRLAERIALLSPETVAVNKYVATLGMEMMGLRNALVLNSVLSTVVHCAQRPAYRRKEMLIAAKERGMREFLAVRDGPFQPEPFGPRSRPRKE